MISANTSINTSYNLVKNVKTERLENNIGSKIIVCLIMLFGI